MTRWFSGWVMFIAVISFAVPSGAQADKAPGLDGIGLKAKRPYPDSKYVEDRRLAGPFIRKLRRIRAAEGNAAAAARIPAAWRGYLKLRLSPGLSEGWKNSQVFDQWGFWIWHEAEFETGTDDPEWQLLLFRSIYDQAKDGKRFDWTMHVRSNVVASYTTLCQWANVRAVSNEAEDYYKGIGFDLDPNNLPVAGDWDGKVPFVKNREFPVMVPNGKAVVRWQRREQKSPTKPIYLDNLLTALIGRLAYEDQVMGRWDRAIERCIWLRRWSDSVNRHNSGKSPKLRISRENEDIHRSASDRMAAIMESLGFTEKALRLIDDGLARKPASNYGLIGRTRLEIRKARLLVESGKEDKSLMADMERFIALEGTSVHFGSGSMDAARIIKAQCLVTLGRLDEAEALLRSMTARYQRRLDGWLAPELALVDIMLERGEFESAGKTLRELMEAIRITGVKIDELDLYRAYVKWAIRSGNWEEALRAHREVIRLVEAFRMTPVLPYEQAVLSRIMAALGDQAESDRLAELARTGATGRESRFVEKIEKQLGERGSKGGPNLAGKIRIQPKRVVSVPLDGLPARAVISLVNQGMREAKGVLTVKGLPARISWDQASGSGIVEVEDAPGTTVERVSGEIRIGAGAVADFSCFGKLGGGAQRTVFLEWSGEGEGTSSCEWIIGEPEKESDGAVIDAAEYQDDPFFLIPVHHHLQAKVSGPVNLRVVASQPCRVELYDGQGALQMVDSEGNGSLAEGGDWLGQDRDRNRAAEVLPEAETGEARFLLQLDPKDWKGEEPLRIRIEWLVGGQWFLAAEDQILPGK